MIEKHIRAMRWLVILSALAAIAILITANASAQGERLRPDDIQLAPGAEGQTVFHWEFYDPYTP